MFGIVRVKFPFGYDIVNPFLFLKALCFLTNVHVFKFPLRKEFQLHRSLVAYIRRKHVEKRERKQQQHSEHRTHIISITLSILPLTPAGPGGPHAKESALPSPG